MNPKDAIGHLPQEKEKIDNFKKDECFINFLICGCLFFLIMEIVTDGYLISVEEPFWLDFMYGVEIITCISLVYNMVGLCKLKIKKREFLRKKGKHIFSIFGDNNNLKKLLYYINQKQKNGEKLTIYEKKFIEQNLLEPLLTESEGKEELLEPLLTEEARESEASELEHGLESVLPPQLVSSLKTLLEEEEKYNIENPSPSVTITITDPNGVEVTNEEQSCEPLQKSIYIRNAKQMAATTSMAGGGLKNQNQSGGGGDIEIAKDIVINSICFLTGEDYDSINSILQTKVVVTKEGEKPIQYTFDAALQPLYNSIMNYIQFQRNRVNTNSPLVHVTNQIYTPVGVLTGGKGQGKRRKTNNKKKKPSRKQKTTKHRRRRRT